MVADLVRTRRRDQRDQSLDELAALHQDVGGAVAPAGLEPQRQLSIRPLLESFARERWPGDVAAEPFESPAVTRGDGDVCVEAHATVPGHSFRSLRIRVEFAGIVRLDSIAEPPPRLTAMGPGCDAGAQRRCGQQRQERLVAFQCVGVVCSTRLDHALDPTCCSCATSR